MKRMDYVTEQELARVKWYYEDPRRAYHNWKHVEQILRYDSEYRELLPFKLGDRQSVAVLFSAVYHDSIYEFNTSKFEMSNEMASELMWKMSPMHDHDLEVSRIVSDMILATEHHFEPWFEASRVTEYFMDLDILNLAVEPAEIVVENNRLIDEEYIRGTNLPKRDILRKRLEFVEGTMKPYARIKQIQLGEKNRLQENIDAVISYLREELLP